MKSYVNHFQGLFHISSINFSETIQERAIALGALELMDSYLKKHNDDEGLSQMALMCVGSLTDAGELSNMEYLE